METLLAAKGDPKPIGCFTGDEKVPLTERSRTWEDQMHDQLRIHRQILYDLALHYLEPLSGNFPRLAYLASLKNPSTNIYAHHPDSAVYRKHTARASPAHSPLHSLTHSLFRPS